MLILTRYAGERVRIESPQGRQIWIDSDEQGLWIDDDGGYEPIEWQGASTFELDGEDIRILHMGTTGRRIQHRLGIDAPKDYVILREELINSGKGD